MYSVRSGKPAFNRTYGTGVFEYNTSNPEVGRNFDEAMTNGTTHVAREVVPAYDFSSFRTIVDVGGGYGTLLLAVLRANPELRGVLFDSPQVVERAAGQIGSTDVAERCTCIGGDFRAAVPAGGDAYLLSLVLHGCEDAKCVAVLQRCRQAMARNGKLLLVEFVLPSGPEPSFGRWSDLHMLVVTGGRERTAPEFEYLLASSGFSKMRVIPTMSGPSLIEAVPV
jgi:hypothetical protein